MSQLPLSHRAAAQPWPLVGRRRELAELCAALRGRQPLVVVTGPPGIGKTRLVREAVAVLRGEGTAVEWTTATAEARSVSLGALGPWLGGGSAAAIEGRRETALALRAELKRRHPARPLVLVVDDAHRLDEESAALVVQLVRAGGPTVLLTVRSDDQPPEALRELLADPSGPADPGPAGGVGATGNAGPTGNVHPTGNGHPTGNVHPTGPGPAGPTQTLAPLSHSEVEEVVPDVLGGPVESISLHKLWLGSAGNPLWLRELVLDGLATGRLAAVHGRWSWDGAPPTARSARLLDLLRARLSGVGPEDARDLDLVALSEPLPVALATAALGDGALSALATTGLVVVDVDGPDEALRLSHPLFGELLRGAVPPLRARNLWRALVRALESSEQPLAIPLRRRAWWYMEADLPIPADIAAGAARDALGHADPALAERLARAGLDAGVGNELDIALVEALSRLGRWDEVVVELRTLEAASLGGDARARLASVKLWPYLFLGDLVGAEAFLADAAAAASTPALADAAATHLATVALFNGDVDRCHQIAWGLLDRPGLDDFSRRWSTRAVVNADALAGRADLAVTTSERELASAGIGSDLGLAPEELMVGYCLGLWRAGHLVRAQDVADRYHRSAVRLADANLAAVTLMLVGISQLERGRVTAAARSLEDAGAAMARSLPLFYIPFVFAELARARALLGDAEGADQALDAVGQGLGAPFPVFRSAVVRSQAWRAACVGRPSVGADLLMAEADRIAPQGQWAQRAVLLHDAARLGAAESVAEDLLAVVQHCDGPLPQAYAAHAAALARSDRAGLTAAAEQLEGLDDLLGAAEAWAEVALVRRNGGMRREAERCAGESARRLARCGLVRTPALSRPVWEADRLTGREVEIAALARQGLHNREIAGRLGCSVRTVENHLGRVYVKLGIAGRHQLPDTLV